ncbi:MAG: hypothetical protein JST61_09715 [Acidobacteria bacterium]|nr:hypothetical protein [Acidobacteriota bacterium]
MPTASPNEAPFSQGTRHHLAKSSAFEPTEETILTIHRRSRSHHGATLRTLGHAAEYLAARSFTGNVHSASDREAIHVLMRLSRDVFDDYARLTRRHHPVADWIMGQAVRIYGAA